MKVQRCRSLGFAALSSAWALFSSKVIAATSSSSDSSPTTRDDSTSPGCVIDYIGDGSCDLSNNNEDCGGYDGGDCCACTCVGTEAFQCYGEYACLDPSAECVDDDDVTTLPETFEYDTPSSYTSTTTTSLGCIPVWVSDGYCDGVNNNEICGYDGGDCCECTCSDNTFICGAIATFACLDPEAPCVDDDDFEPFSEDDDDSTSSTGDDLPDSSSSSLCLEEVIGDGNCDSENNIDECDYDGGDCCECDCVSTSDFTCGDNDYDCIDPSSSCINGYVLASSKTTITGSANAYDTRPGEASDDIGCGEDVCAPALSLDGISDDIESRWSCAQKIVPDGGLCEIEFAFDDPQDVMEVQVAFWKGDERSRTLKATINGETMGEFDSYTGSTFNALGIQGVGVKTMAFTTAGLPENDWISLIEVHFLVEP